MTSFDLLQKHPRAALLSGPTPVEHLARLSQHLGIEVFVKRDDLTGLGMGGNKIRQLEFYLGDALAKGADTVLITGAVQSNYVCAAAAAAAKLGLDAVVQLEERVPGMSRTYHDSGNVLLDDLLGARRLTFPEGENEAGADQALRDEADRLRLQGRRPYVIPLGLDNPPLGALGYMLAAQEVVDQGIAFDCAVVASGSGYTHTGFLCGLRALGIRVPVHGACVRRSADQQRGRIAAISGKLAALLGCAPLLGNDDVLTWICMAPATADGAGSAGGDFAHGAMRRAFRRSRLHREEPCGADRTRARWHHRERISRAVHPHRRIASDLRVRA